MHAFVRAGAAPPARRKMPEAPAERNRCAGDLAPAANGREHEMDRAAGPDGATAPRAKRVAKRAERAPGD